MGTARSEHTFDRQSGTGRGRELAKEGHGKGNWGCATEDNRALTGIHAEDAFTTETLLDQEDKSTIFAEPSMIESEEASTTITLEDY